jgi:hypothetical protein
MSRVPDAHLPGGLVSARPGLPMQQPESCASGTSMIPGAPAAVEAPVLLIIFNRPDHTRRALSALRRARPKIVLVAADGPRSREESVVCSRAREVVAGIDWDCRLLTNYSDANLGCGIRVHTGVDWALSLYERVIVLEDDCIPEPTFFTFCQELLERYADDERVMHISGNNFQPSQPTVADSYYFSKYTHAWGWATWRRAWRHFDWALKGWPEWKKARLLRSWCDDPYEERYWTEIFDRMHRGAPDVWDYQWTCTCWAQSGLSILPTVNLVSNHGYGPDATHTKDDGPYMKRPTQPMGQLHHPVAMIRNHDADAYTFAHNFGGEALRAGDAMRVRLKARLGPVLKPFRGIRQLVNAVGRRGTGNAR